LKNTELWIAPILAVFSGVLAAQSPQDVQLSEHSAQTAIAAPCSQDDSSLDILSDTDGASFRPYLKRMTMNIRENWYRWIPESARDKTACLAITFIVHKDGQVTDLKIERSSGTDALDQSASKSIEATEFFPALPGRFQGDHLAFRFSFAYHPSVHLRALQIANEPPRVLSTDADGPVYKVGHGVTVPHATYMPSPEYSEKGRKKKIQGTVILQIVVTPEGTVRDAKVVTSLEPSLDEWAIKGVERWKFQPARKDGVPVAVQLMTEVSFHLY
jgi:TonB family protein